MHRVMGVMSLIVAMPVPQVREASAQVISRIEEAQDSAVSRAHASLARLVTVRLNNLPLRRVLMTIDRQASLGLVYTSEVVPLERLVTLDRSNVTAESALREALAGTGATVEVTREGRVALVSSRHPDLLGTIRGRVTAETSGQPIIGAHVTVVGTALSATSGDSGLFMIENVPRGEHSVLARYIGYAPLTKKVVVDSAPLQVDFVLSARPTRLDELVTTTSGRQRRVELGNDITRINADSVVRNEPIRSLTDLLENRVPGLTVRRTSGAPGDPARLRLRGAGSPLRNNDPIVVVDGIRVYAEQSANRGGNLAQAGDDDASSGITGSFRFAAPSPLDYIDPNSIETVEVLSGPSAATLYGQDAANGVIVVTTKKGRPGPARWTANLEHGRSQMSGDYPALTLRWGHIPFFNDQPVWCPITNRTGNGGGNCEADSITTFQLLNDPALTVLGRGHRTAGSLGVSGGSSSLTYSVTGSYGYELGLPKLPDYEVDRYEAENGAAPPDWMRRPQHLMQWNASSQLTARLSPTATVSLRASAGRVVQQRSTLEQQLSALMPTYVDRASGTYYQIAVGGIAPVTSDVLTNYYKRATANTQSFTNGVSLDWQTLPWLTLRSDVGFNLDQRDDETYLPRGASSAFSDSTGSLNNGHGSSLMSTANVFGTARVPLGLGIDLRFTTGINYTSTSISDLTVASSNLAEGTSLIGSLINSATRSVQSTATFGWFVEPAIGHGQFWLNAGLRSDGGSNYGARTRPVFPKINLSYVLSDEPFFPLKNVFQTFRARVAYGRASRQPGPADQLRVYSTPVVILANGTADDAVGLKNLGNTQLRPERSSEFEAGIDADLLDSRVSVSFTGYRKTTDDALMTVPLAPSVYGDGVSVWKNIGLIRNTGLTASLTAQLLRRGSMSWSTQLLVSQNRNLVVKLGNGVLPFYSNATGVNGGIRVAAGYPLFGRWSVPIVSYADVNGNGVLEGPEYLLGDTAVYVGPTEPNYGADLFTNVSLWHGAVTMSAGFHYDDGLTQLNQTAQGIAPFSAAWNQPGSSLAAQAAAVALTKSGPNVGPFFSTEELSDYNWIQTTNTVRFNSLSVSYRLPMPLTRRLGAQALRILVQGTNLGLWSNYRGLDPNVNAFATGNGVVDNGVLPQSRVWQVRVNATY